MTGQETAIAALPWLLVCGILLLCAAYVKALWETRVAAPPVEPEHDPRLHVCRRVLVLGLAIVCIALAGFALGAREALRKRSEALCLGGVPLASVGGPVGIRLAGGGGQPFVEGNTRGIRVGWNELRAQDGRRELRLEISNLSTVDGASGPWTVCMGLPVRGPKLANVRTHWQMWGPAHSHDDAIEAGHIQDRDRGDYRTYACRVDVNDEADTRSVSVPTLYLNPGELGKYQIGMCLAQGAPEPEGGDSARLRVQRYRWTIVLDCTAPE